MRAEAHSSAPSSPSVPLNFVAADDAAEDASMDICACIALLHALYPKFGLFRIPIGWPIFCERLAIPFLRKCLCHVDSNSQSDFHI